MGAVMEVGCQARWCMGEGLSLTLHQAQVLGEEGGETLRAKGPGPGRPGAPFVPRQGLSPCTSVLEPLRPGAQPGSPKEEPAAWRRRVGLWPCSHQVRSPAAASKAPSSPS